MTKLEENLKERLPQNRGDDPCPKEELHSLSHVLHSKEVLEGLGIKNASIGIILGTGLGNVCESLQDKITVDYEDCPYFPQSTAIGHNGKVVQGKLHNKEIIAMDGRFHTYEGYSLKEVTYPVRVLKALGVETLILTNAAGGMNPRFSLGDLMLIEDHINLMGDSPLVGGNDECLGPRFPDMSEPYDKGLLKVSREVALEGKIQLQEGVYVGVKGPQLETRAEYRFLRSIGADAVGMSTVPEAIVAKHAGMRILAVSTITDLCFPDTLEPINIERIIETAKKAEPLLTRLITGVIQRI